MAAIDVDRFRTQLVELRDDLQRQIADLDPAGGSGPDFDENFADSGQVAAEVGESVALANRIREHLAEVDAAVERLDNDEFGVCEVCGKAIAVPRLEAIPATRYCIDHA